VNRNPSQRRRYGMISLTASLLGLALFLPTADAGDRDPVGACCFPDGTCEILTELECIDLCYGDLNCDWMIDFEDINFFVEALQCPGGVGWPHDCLWITGDCDGDGAVTFDDINPFVERLGWVCPPGLGGEWLGPGTTCGLCPCDVLCPPGSVPEQELCGEDTNAGCGSVGPNAFEPIYADVPICGTAWYDGMLRDTDWYEITVAENTEFTLTVQAEFPVLIALVETDPPGSGDCWDMTGYLDPYANVGACEIVTIVSDCLPAGTYWFWVGPQFVEDTVDCPAEYWIELTTTPCAP